MRSSMIAVIACLMTVVGQVASADDLTDSNRFLCAAVQATMCVEDGECVVDLPWNLNIPEFIEVDLEAKRLATTAASGENRATPIQHLSRSDGSIASTFSREAGSTSRAAPARRLPSMPRPRRPPRCKTPASAFAPFRTMRPRKPVLFAAGRP